MQCQMISAKRQKKTSATVVDKPSLIVVLLVGNSSSRMRTMMTPARRAAKNFPTMRKRTSSKVTSSSNKKMEPNAPCAHGASALTRVAQSASDSSTPAKRMKLTTKMKRMRKKAMKTLRKSETAKAAEAGNIALKTFDKGSTAHRRGRKNGNNEPRVNKSKVGGKCAPETGKLNADKGKSEKRVNDPKTVNIDFILDNLGIVPPNPMGI